jgi:hypothetical protein
MKRLAQQRLRAEFESRKNEFPSYFDFLEARTNESPWQREFWAKIAAAQRRRGSGRDV